MKKEKRLCLLKIAEKISSNEEEQEIIKYGLHQGVLILLNILTLVICGILWKELPFVVLVFMVIFILRPYAGGYHANTELSCYLISTIMMNIFISLHKIIVLSNMIFMGIYIVTAMFICIFTPVENPIHCLDEPERRKYAKKTKWILLCNGIIMGVGMCINQRIILEAIVYAQVMVVIAMMGGMWKYKSR